jgi:hypothetical protein
VAVFAGKRELLNDESVEKAKTPLFKQIGRLQVENDFLREKLGPLLCRNVASGSLPGIA